MQQNATKSIMNQGALETASYADSIYAGTLAKQLSRGVSRSTLECGRSCLNQ